MNHLSSLPKDWRLPILILGGLVLLGFGLSLAILPPLFPLALAGGLAFIGLVALEPALALGLLLVVRGSVEIVQELFGLSLGGGLSFNLTGLLNILAFGLAGFFLVRRFLRGDVWLPSAPLALLGILVLIGLLGIPGARLPVDSLKALTRLGGHLGLALLALEAGRRPNTPRRLLRVITLAAIPGVLLGFFQALTGGGYFFEGLVNTQFAFRPLGTFGHPAILASFLITITCLLIAALAWNYPLWPRPVLFAGSGVCLGLIVLTFARAEWIGALAALAVIGWLRFRRWILIVFPIALVLLLSLPAVQERLSGEKSDESVSWRLEVWDASLKILERPRLLGHGLDNSPQLIGEVFLNVFEPPHNDFLRTAIEMGVAGLVVFLAMQAALLWTAWRSLHAAGPPVLRVLGLALLALTVSGLVIGLADNYLSYTSVQWYNWTILGTIIALRQGGQAPDNLQN